MSQLPTIDPFDRPHPMWRIHLFFAGLLGVAGFVCIMTGALAQIGVLFLGLSLAWGVTAVIVGVFMQHHDHAVPYDESKEFTNMDIK